MNEESDDGFDILLSNIGFGRWQIPIILATVLVGAQIPVHMVGSPFISAPMNFHCYEYPPSVTAPSDHLQSPSDLGDTNNTYFNDLCLPYTVNLTEVPDDYSGYEESIHYTGLPSCPYIEYDTSIFTSTINSQFNIVCEQEGLRPLYQMMFSVGGLFGSSLSGFLGDRLGRTRALQIGCLGHAIGVILMVTVPSYTVILLMRVVIGAMTNIMLLPAWSLSLEVTPSRHRSVVGMLLGLPYSCFVMINSGLAYAIRSWKYILLACVLPGFILFPLAMYIDESPSWLIQKGKEKKVTQILKKAAKLNQAELTTPVDVAVKKLVEAATIGSSGRADTTNSLSESKSLCESFKSQCQELLRYLRAPAMRIILIMSPILWFLHAFLYLSIAINANNFARSGTFLYIALTGVMDGSAILLTTPLATRCGRRVMIFGGMFGGACLFLLEILIPDDYTWIKWVFVMLGFLLVAGAYQVNYVYAPELFPTETRTRGFGFLNLVANIGYMCTPIVTESFANYTWWAGGVFFGVSGLLGSFTVPFLPETRNKPLPETLQDVEERRNRSMKKSRGEEKGYENRAIEMHE